MNPPEKHGGAFPAPVFCCSGDACFLPRSLGFRRRGLRPRGGGGGAPGADPPRVPKTCGRTSRFVHSKPMVCRNERGKPWTMDPPGTVLFPRPRPIEPAPRRRPRGFGGPSGFPPPSLLPWVNGQGTRAPRPVRRNDGAPFRRVGVPLTWWPGQASAPPSAEPGLQARTPTIARRDGTPATAPPAGPPPRRSPRRPVFVPRPTTPPPARLPGPRRHSPAVSRCPLRT